MEYYRGKSGFLFQNTCITIGKFDGLHIGHRKLIDNLNKYKTDKMTTAMLTFDYNPANLFSEKEMYEIYSEQEKLHLLRELPLDAVIAYPFTAQTAKMSAREFVSSILIDTLGMKLLVVGTDFRFGNGRSGDVDYLHSISSEYGFELIVCEKEIYENEIISSTRIRSVISKGDIKSANAMLGSPYFVMGKIAHGKGIGRHIAVPTANIMPDAHKLLPPDGVYVTEAVIGNKRYKSVTNIGKNPTVNEGNAERTSIETYIFDCSEELYDKEIVVEFFHFIRPEIKFQNSEELKKQIEKDINFSKNYTLQMI